MAVVNRCMHLVESSTSLREDVFSHLEMGAPESRTLTFVFGLSDRVSTKGQSIIHRSIPPPIIPLEMRPHILRSGLIGVNIEKLPGLDPKSDLELCVTAGDRLSVSGSGVYVAVANMWKKYTGQQMCFRWDRPMTKDLDECHLQLRLLSEPLFGKVEFLLRMEYCWVIDLKEGCDLHISDIGDMKATGSYLNIQSSVGFDLETDLLDHLDGCLLCHQWVNRISNASRSEFRQRYRRLKNMFKERDMQDPPRDTEACLSANGNGKDEVSPDDVRYALEEFMASTFDY